MTQEYILLELCEKYSIDPLRMDELPDEIKISMIAKWHLEVEMNNRANKSVEN